jgi:small subunit ribosomal protein S8e
MATKWHLRSRKTKTGGKLRPNIKKKKRVRGTSFSETRIGERRAKNVKSRGGNRKIRLLSVESINVADPRTGKIIRTKLVSVKDNQANVHYIRRNILTKGALVETEAGTARVTSRPGQDGIVNAVLVEEKK